MIFKFIFELFLSYKKLVYLFNKTVENVSFLEFVSMIQKNIMNMYKDKYYFNTVAVIQIEKI